MEWPATKEYARRVNCLEEPHENRRLALVTDRDSSAFFSVPASQDAEIQAAVNGSQNLVHVCQHEGILLHVGLAHVLGQTSARDCW